MTFAQGIFDYFRACPNIDAGNRLNFNAHGVKPTEYVIDTAPSGNVIQRYASGSVIKEKLFALGSIESYGEDARIQIQNSGIYEAFEAWINAQNESGNLPATPEGTSPIKLECVTDGYLFTTSGNTAIYQIQIKLTYIQKGKR